MLLDTRRKLNVHKTFIRHAGPFLGVLCTFNLHPYVRSNLRPVKYPLETEREIDVHKPFNLHPVCRG